jgi:hypothetical protein
VILDLGNFLIRPSCHDAHSFVCGIVKMAFSCTGDGKRLHDNNGDVNHNHYLLTP